MKKMRWPNIEDEFVSLSRFFNVRLLEGWMVCRAERSGLTEGREYIPLAVDILTGMFVETEEETELW